MLISTTLWETYRMNDEPNPHLNWGNNDENPDVDAPIFVP